MEIRLVRSGNKSLISKIQKSNFFQITEMNKLNNFKNFSVNPFEITCAVDSNDSDPNSSSCTLTLEV